MKERPVTNAEALAAILQLRTLLVADAPIPRPEVERLANLAAHLTPDDMHPIEVTDFLVFLIEIRSPEHFGTHDVKDPATDAISILDRLLEPRPRTRSWLSRIWRRK